MDETIELEDETPTLLLRRQLAVGAVIVAVIALTLLAAAALGAEKPTRRVAVKSEPTAATSPRHSDTTTASSTTVPALTTPSAPPATSASEIPAGPTVEQQIGQIFTTLFDPNATDEQRLAVIDNSSDLEAVIQAARAHPMYKELGNTTVTVEWIDFLNLWSADVNVRYSHPALGWMTNTGRVVLVDGTWKVDRESFCSGLATLTTGVGGPTISCDEILNPPTTTTSTTAAPTTTSIVTSTTVH